MREGKNLFFSRRFFGFSGVPFPPGNAPGTFRSSPLGMGARGRGRAGAHRSSKILSAKSSSLHQSIGKRLRTVGGRFLWHRPPTGASPGARPRDGFLDPVSDPPRTPGKNARRVVANSLQDSTPPFVPRDAVGLGRKRLRARLRKGRSVLAKGESRAGAPLKEPTAFRWKGKPGVWLEKRQYARLLYGRRKAELRLRSTQPRVFTRPPLLRRIAVASMLQALGVSATKVPLVVSTVLFGTLGFVPRKSLFSIPTALKYVRVAGSALQDRLVNEVSASGSCFFFGFDTSGRGGHLAAFVLSFLSQSGPACQFYDFSRPLSGLAPDLVACVESAVNPITDSGGVFGGITTDGEPTMVGAQNGVGVLLHVLHPGIRHDTCEHHALARLMAVLYEVFPACMNVLSVTQFLFITWYILNDDWEMYKGRMIKFLNFDSRRADVRAVLGRFAGGRVEALEKLTKPLKPNPLRWGTVAEIVSFVSLYFEALGWAFEHERMTVGANAGSCSVATICGQWTKWSASPHLLVLLQVTREFIEVIWEPANKEVDKFDNDYHVDGCFKTFSRPRRVLDLLMKIEAVQRDPKTLKSYAEVGRIYRDADAVRKFFDQLLLFSRESVRRNSGRYLSDIYLFGALADPDFAPFVFEAFSFWKKDHRRANLSSKAARLVEAMKENSTVSPLLDQLLAEENWSQISELMEVLKRDRAEFVSNSECLSCRVCAV